MCCVKCYIHLRRARTTASLFSLLPSILTTAQKNPFVAYITLMNQMDPDLVASYKNNLSPPTAPFTSTIPRYPSASQTTNPLLMLNMTYFGSNPRDTYAGVTVDLGWNSTMNTEWRSVTPRLIQNNKEYRILRSWSDTVPSADRVTVILPDTGTAKQKVHFEVWCTTFTTLDPFLCGKSPSFFLLPPLLGPSLSATAPTASASLETSTSMSFTPYTPYTPFVLPSSAISRNPSFSMGAITGIAIISLITFAILCGCTMQRRAPSPCPSRRRRTMQKISITHPQIVAPWDISFLQSNSLNNDARCNFACTSVRIPQSPLNISYPIVTGIGDDGGDGPHRTLAPPLRRIELETQAPLLTPISRPRVATLHHLPAPLPIAVSPPRSNARRAPSTRCYTCHPDHAGQGGDMPVLRHYPRDTRGSEEQVPFATGSGVEDLNRHLDGYLHELHRISLDSSTLGHTRSIMRQHHDGTHASSRHPGTGTGQGSVGNSWRAPLVRPPLYF
ncbi:unnamed protein product [Mortierella alpina]